jgi:DNA repair protein RecO (recombination protein O)
MAYLRDTAIVLKCEPFREHDAWLTLYGRTHGKMTAVARGARRMDAKCLGHIEPLSEIEVMIAKGVTFDKIAVAKLTRPRSALRERLGTLAVAGAFAHLIDKLTHPEVGDAAIYHLLSETLDLSTKLERDPSSERGRLLLAATSLKLLDALGYAPSWEETMESDTARLLRFMRTRPLGDLLHLTAPTDLFTTASSAVENAMMRAPLQTEPHGSRTIVALLS